MILLIITKVNLNADAYRSNNNDGNLKYLLLITTIFYRLLFISSAFLFNSFMLEGWLYI